MNKSSINRLVDSYLAKSLGQLLYDALFYEQAAQQPKPTKNKWGFSFAMSFSDAPQCDFDSAVALSIKGDIEANAGRRPTFQSHYLNNQLASNNIAAANDLSLEQLAKLPKIKSLSEFEVDFNRVLQNYPTREAYEEDSKLADHLANIDTPTLCLSSEDDLIAPLRLLPLAEIRKNEKLCMVLTKLGGHMGFIDGFWWPTKPYFGQRVLTSYLGAIISEWDAGRDFRTRV